jgi:hypothetical protein
VEEIVPMGETAKPQQAKQTSSAAKQLATPAAPEIGILPGPASIANVVQRAATDPGKLSPPEVKLLQNTVGNRAVGRLLQQAA